MSTTRPRRTALFEEHQKLGAKLVDFFGWEMPIQYSGLLDEHLNCRKNVGLFDVSHMGEVHIEGEEAENYVNFLVTNNVKKLAINQVLYTPMCHETGGIVDDLLVYRRSKDRFLLVINAANTDKDFAHMKKVHTQHFPGDREKVRLSNESPNYSQIAIQGRHAEAILKTLTAADLSQIKYYWFTEGTILNTIPAILSRTGYTGEDGFEVYLPWNKGPEVWRALLEAGRSYGIKPVGLGARDTLRLEMKFPLYGNELNDTTTPLEASLGWCTKMDKGDFMGRPVIAEQSAQGVKQLLVGLTLLDRGIPRSHYPVYDETGVRLVGEITSGNQSPCSKASIGIAYVETSLAKVKTRLLVEIRGTKIPAEVIPTPFYKRDYK